MAAFYIFIFHGDFVQSVRLTYILPSHIEVEKFLVSDFGRVLEIGITWWSVAQLLMSLLTCVVTLSHHSQTHETDVKILHFQKKHLTSSLTVTSSPSTHTFSILTHWPTVQLEDKLWRGQPFQLLSPPPYDTGVHPWVLLDSGSFQHCAALDTDPFVNHNARSNCNIWTLEGNYQEY